MKKYPFTPSGLGLKGERVGFAVSRFNVSGLEKCSDRIVDSNRFIVDKLYDKLRLARDDDFLPAYLSCTSGQRPTTEHLVHSSSGQKSTWAIRKLRA